MSDLHAEPETHFAVTLSLAAVNRSDYEAVEAALRGVRDRFSRGGSSVTFEVVRPGTVINR